jgi:hypothetical protein
MQWGGSPVTAIQSTSLPHFLHMGSLHNPMICKCLLKVLCPVSRPVTTLVCVLLKDNCRVPILMHVTVPYHNCIYNSLPTDEPSSSKRVEDITKLKIEILRKSALRWFISYKYIVMHGARNTQNIFTFSPIKPESRAQKLMCCIQSFLIHLDRPMEAV